MPKLSRSILKRIEERPFAEKQNVAREAYHQWRLSEKNRPGGLRPKADEGAKLLAAELRQKSRGVSLAERSFAKMFPLVVPERGDDDADVDPYKIEKGGMAYEYWWEGAWLKIRTSLLRSPAIRGRGRKTVSSVKRITIEGFRTGYFVNRRARAARSR